MSCDCGAKDNLLDGEGFTPETVSTYKGVNGNVQHGGSCDQQAELPNLLAGCSPSASEMAWANRYGQVGGAKMIKINETAANIEKMAVKLLTMKSEKGVKNFVEKNMTSNASKHLPKLLKFMKTMPKKMVEYGVFGLTPTSAKMFILAQGTMKNGFYRKSASNKKENLTCVADIKVSPRTQKINDLKLKFEFLDQEGIADLRRLQRSIMLAPVNAKEQSGGGYYMAVAEPPIGKMPAFGSYNNQCPPVFKGNLTGGGVLQELAEPMASVFAPGLYAVQGMKEGLNAVKNIAKKRRGRAKRGGRKQKGGVACGNVSLKNTGCQQPDWGLP